MTELRLNWDKKASKRMLAAFLAVVLCVTLLPVTPVRVMAGEVLKAVTAGNGTENVTPSNGTEKVTPGNGTEATTSGGGTQGITPGNGTDNTTSGSGTQSTTPGNGTENTTTDVTNNTVTISSVKVSKSSLKYSGKSLTPAVVVKDSKGKVIPSTGYKVSYSNNKRVGTATVKVTGKGNVKGTKTTTFKIVPKTTSITEIVSAKKGFRVTWKKQATQTTGYQIRYSTSSKFTASKTKEVTFSKNSTVKKTVTNLTGNKKYYVQVRTYKKVSGKTYYSDWSDTVSIKTRK